MCNADKQNNEINALNSIVKLERCYVIAWYKRFHNFRIRIKIRIRSISLLYRDNALVFFLNNIQKRQGMFFYILSDNLHFHLQQPR